MRTTARRQFRIDQHIRIGQQQRHSIDGRVRAQVKQYEIYYRRWLLLGWPAFIGVLIIFYLMVAKPAM